MNSIGKPLRLASVCVLAAACPPLLHAEDGAGVPPEPSVSMEKLEDGDASARNQTDAPAQMMTDGTASSESDSDAVAQKDETHIQAARRRASTLKDESLGNFWDWLFGDEEQAKVKPKPPKDRFRFLTRGERANDALEAENIEQETISPFSMDETPLDAKKVENLERPVENSKAARTSDASARTNSEAGDEARKSAGDPPPQERKKNPPFYEELILFDGDEEVAASLVFNSAPLLDVIPAFADILDFDFTVDPDIKALVSLNLNSKMTRRELWNALAVLIESAGAGVAVENNLVRIAPMNKFSQRSKLAMTPGAGAEICFYPLKFALAKEVVAQIRPFLGSAATCVEVTRPNAVLICDTRDNIAKIQELLKLLDDNGKSRWPRAVLPCRNILPSKIADELRTILPVLGFVVLQIQDRAEQPGSIRVTAVDRLHLLVASAATEEAIQEIRNWVDILDSSYSLDHEGIFVYKVMHGSADQLLKALAVVYNVQGTSFTIDSETGNERTESVNTQNQTQNRQNRPRQQNQAEQRQGSTISNTVNTTTDLKSSIFENPVRVFADGALNRLVIRTTPRTYASMKALLDRLDVVPAQVLLQVVVVEVSLTDSTQFGVEFSAKTKWGGNTVRTGSNFSNLNPNTSSSSSSSGDDSSGGGSSSTTTDTGYSFLISDPKDPDTTFGYIRALAGNEFFKVISSPQILVSSHKEATINVGQETPYTGSSVTSVSATDNLLSTVQYKDSGTKLVITPQVTSTDLISLDVNQTISTVNMTSVSNTVSAPVLTTREVETNMTIHNGQTMVIGGLIEETKQDAVESLPFLIDIPLIRRLFGSTDASIQRREILVLITGHIIDENSRVDAMLTRYNDAIDALNEFDESSKPDMGNASRLRKFERGNL